jgi:hypothetical protein
MAPCWQLSLTHAVQAPARPAAEVFQFPMELCQVQCVRLAVYLHVWQTEGHYRWYVLCAFPIAFFDVVSIAVSDTGFVYTAHFESSGEVKVESYPFIDVDDLAAQPSS